MKLRPFSAFRLKVIALAIAASSYVFGPVVAQTDYNALFQREPFLSAKRFAQEKKYPELWDVLWNAAKSGDSVALSFLVFTITTFGLIPPGVSPEAVDENRNLVLALMVYGAADEAEILPEDARLFRKALISLLLTQSQYVNAIGVPNARCARPDDRLKYCVSKKPPPVAFPLENRMELARCYIEHATSKGCLEKAIALGIVEPFADFAAKFDKKAALSSIPARCTAGPHTMCYDARIDESEPK